MVNQYLFIEQGSLSQSDINKLVENVKNTGTSLMMYNRGSTKPELVTIDNSGIDIEAIKTAAAREYGEFLIDNLLTFIDEVAIKHSHYDEMTRTTSFSMQIKTTPEYFVKRFADFLNEKHYPDKK